MARAQAILTFNDADAFRRGRPRGVELLTVAFATADLSKAVRGRTPPIKRTDGVNVFGRQVQLSAILHSVLLLAADGDQCRWYPPRAA